VEEDWKKRPDALARQALRIGASVRVYYSTVHHFKISSYYNFSKILLLHSAPFHPNLIFFSKKKDHANHSHPVG